MQKIEVGKRVNFRNKRNVFPRFISGFLDFRCSANIFYGNLDPKLTRAIKACARAKNPFEPPFFFFQPPPLFFFFLLKSFTNDGSGFYKQDKAFSKRQRTFPTTKFTKMCETLYQTAGIFSIAAIRTFKDRQDR